MPLIDLTDQTFGRLLVIKKEGRRGGHISWLCLCECGIKKIIAGRVLREGKSRSCGCLAKEKATLRQISHGMHGTPTYICWKNMKARCGYKRNGCYHNYGGRGIKVCDEWLSFENFMRDMGRRPVDMSLDRIDNDGDYEPGNCRWATDRQQQQNTRKNIYVNYRGQQLCLSEASRKSGVKYTTIYERLKAGWPETELFKLPRAN